MSPVFNIDWNDSWDCYVATHSQYRGIVGTSGEAWIALKDLLTKINNQESKHVYAVPGGWECPHEACRCTAEDGSPLAGGVR